MWALSALVMCNPQRQVAHRIVHCMFDEYARNFLSSPYFSHFLVCLFSRFLPLPLPTPVRSLCRHGSSAEYHGISEASLRAGRSALSFGLGTLQSCCWCAVCANPVRRGRGGGTFHRLYLAKITPFDRQTHFPWFPQNGVMEALLKFIQNSSATQNSKGLAACAVRVIVFVHPPNQVSNFLL